ncbi:MAG: acylphosphatase [Hormoscilla sp.]
MEKPSQPKPEIRAHVFISGRVQGVGYRFSTRSQAKHLGIAGWVRNLPDRRVEAVFEGSQSAVEAMIRWCYQGPLDAAVTDVAVNKEQPQGLQGFDILYKF